MAPPADCAGWRWEELAWAPYGPFGAVTGTDNAFVGARWARRPLPMLTAVACCFAHDLSFPTAWYDFEQSDDEWAALAAAAARRPWAARRERAHFRGSVYWYESHGRTRAFAASLVSPDEVDVDWYEKVDTAALETDGENVFGAIGDHAKFKWLLSLEGHSYWSFRLRQLAHLGSAVLHQDLPCHEWWHAALRPYEHYVPLARDLSDLRAALRALRRHDGAAARMGARLQRLAPKILGQAAVVAHVRRLLEGLAALQTYTPRLHPDAVPLPRLAAEGLGFEYQ